MNNTHWSQKKERGNLFFLRITLFLVKYTPLFFVRFIAFFVCFYFYLTSKTARNNIKNYQQHLKNQFPQTPLPKIMPVYRQFIQFGIAIADRFAAWQDKMPPEQLIYDDPDGIFEKAKQNQGRGEILVCSHLGNVEMVRCFARYWLPDLKMNVLMHGKNAEKINQMLKQAGAEDMRIVQVIDLDTEKMLDLSQRLDKGEWIVIAADRTAPVANSKTVLVPFLGENALFPQGAWLLAMLLKSPVSLLFAMKKNKQYQLHLRHFADIPPHVSGKKRQEYIEQTAQKYATILAEFAAEYPLQWFNFHDFWNKNQTVKN